MTGTHRVGALQLTYPRRIGIAADLLFIVRDPIAFLADCLLVYDQIVVPAEAPVLNLLYSLLTPLEMKRLLVEHRIVFCPAASILFLRATEDLTLTHSSVISSVQTDLAGFIPDVEHVAQIVRQLEQHLLMRPNADYRRWTEVFTAASAAFIQAAERPDYEWLYPTDPRSGGPRLDRFVGLRSGLARVSDLVAAGVTDFEMDKELPVLLEVCFPASGLGETIHSKEVRMVDARDVVERLHRIENLPALGQFARQRNWTSEVLIDILLSDEANDLRCWLRQNAVPGIDVRDAYMAAEKRLPSKKYWNGWLRFGTVTGVSTVVGFLCANPIIGAVAGAAIGAVDQAIGPGVQQRLSDPYHPISWLSFMKRL